MAAAPAFASFVERLVGGDVAAALAKRRRRMIEATTSPGDLVAVPAHGTQALIDAVRACGRRPWFAPVGRDGATVLDGTVEVAAVVHQPLAGVLAGHPDPSLAFCAGSGRPSSGPAVLIDAPGVAMIDDHPAVAAAVLGRAADALALAAAQWERWGVVHDGLRLAAGLPLLGPPAGASSPQLSGLVPSGVVVRLPDGADPITFVAYAQAELTPVWWAATGRPLHPQARQQLNADQLRSSVASLAQLIVVPVAPTECDEELAQSVLGIVKAAEYTGWRWCEDRARARWYAEFLDDLYGPDHDAYRPAFDIG